MFGDKQKVVFEKPLVYNILSRSTQLSTGDSWHFWQLWPPTIFIDPANLLYNYKGVYHKLKSCTDLWKSSVWALFGLVF